MGLSASPLLVSQSVSQGTHYLQLGYRGAFASPQSRIGLLVHKYHFQVTSHVVAGLIPKQYFYVKIIHQTLEI